VERFVVGLDGSDASKKALRFALKHARHASAGVYLVHARSVPGVGPGSALSETLDAFERQARAAAESVYRRKLKPDDILVRAGSPVDVLVGMCAELHANMLVVGTSGTGHPGTGTFGSTAARLVIQSRIPVLVVP
jgi:nucleotide-binding universal stress UspA family protein